MPHLFKQPPNCTLLGCFPKHCCSECPCTWTGSLIPKDSAPGVEIELKGTLLGGCSLAVFQRHACLWREGESCGEANTHGKVWSCKLFAVLDAIVQGLVPDLQWPLGFLSQLAQNHLEPLI